MCLPVRVFVRLSLASPATRAQLAECVKTIIYDDFPEKWPELMPSIMENLANGEPPRLYAALWSLRIVTRKYEYKDVEVCQVLRHTSSLSSSKREVPWCSFTAL